MKSSRPLLRDDRCLLLIVLAVALLALLPGLGHPVIQREQELRVALTARHMVESGSWLDPQYLGEPRFRKPPLMYWAVAAAYTIGGRTDSAFLARLPSALAGVGLVALLFLAGRRALGRRRAFFTALIAATSFIFLRQSRLSETDTLLALFTAATALAGYASLRRGLRIGWTVLSGIASGLGFLTKGPAALAIPLLAWLVFLAWPHTPRPRAARIAAHLLLWIALSLAIPAPWYLHITSHAESAAQLRAEMAATFGGETRHAGPWFYYFYAAFHALAPWSLALPFALVACIRRQPERRRIRFALAWFAAAFLALSVTSSKQIHYALLLVPPASLLIGAHLARRRTRTKPILLVVLLVLALHLVIALFVMPHREPKQPLADLLRAHRTELRAAPNVFLVGRHRATIEFHASRPIRDTDNLAEVRRLARAGDWVIVNAKPDALPAAPDFCEESDGSDGSKISVRLWRVR